MSQLTMTRGTFDDLKDHVMPIRIQVFVDEQKVPVEIEQDERDPMCVHVLVTLDEQPVGTGRIDIANGGKIGRIAVLREYRRQKIGKCLMTELEEVARENSLPEVYLNSQLTAVPFYQSLGYTSVGDQFSEAGLDHVKMVKELE